MHRLLKRQLDEYLAENAARATEELRELLEAVAEQYARADDAHTELERLSVAVRASQYGLWDFDIAEASSYFSDRYCEILGLTCEEMSNGEAWLERVHQDDLEDVGRRFAEHLAGDSDFFEADYRLRHADGSYRWVNVRGRALRDDQGKAHRIAGSMTDITARKEVEERLRRHAYHDESTGYPNRRLLLDRLRRALARKDARGKSFALVAIAIDAHDKIADSLGHEVCEEAVGGFARRIADIANPIDTLARTRKDQLCLLIESEPELTRLLVLSDRIQDAMRHPLPVKNEEVFSSVSLGIVCSDGAMRSPQDYLDDAVVAVNRAASSGGARHAVFDLVMHQEAARRLHLEKELRRAIANAEFDMLYQPIVSLRTGTVTGFEALLRWRHPQRGLIGPNVFLDVAESGGHLSAIFDQVFPGILRRMQQWQARGSGGSPPFVNVNLSRAQFKDPDLLARIDRAMEKVSLAPHTLGFEMTESVMVEDRQVIETLRQLKARQVRLLIDDFGTGYSCLSNLSQFPLDSVKIDKSFVAEVGKSPEDGEIARAITNLAHSLAMDVTIEGIENETQLRFAYSLGCEYAQGYHFAMPLSADDAGRRIEQRYRTSLTPPSGKRPRKPKSRGRILVIDADPKRLDRHAETLDDNELEVVRALDGHEGLAQAESELPDVAMVAMDLPGMGSIELCRKLRESNETARIPILLVTQADTGDEAISECLDLGASDCLRDDAPTRVMLARVTAQVAVSHAQHKLRTMAMTDEQTGVFTRRFLFQALRRSIKATVRAAPRGLACLVVDADGFKHVNATQGHIDADALLQNIATTIDRTTRETDLVARFGGAEFVVLLHDTDAEGARSAAEKIRAAVEASCETTVSVGGAVLQHASVENVRASHSVDELIAQLLRDADRAKYAAKNLGKNRVVFASDSAIQTA